MSVRPIFQKDVDAFLRLNKKNLDFKADEIRIILQSLPTDVIERIFGATTIHENEDRLFVDFGFNQIDNVAKEIQAYGDLYNKGELEDYLSRRGHKVNIKKVGVRNKTQ